MATGGDAGISERRRSSLLTPIIAPVQDVDVNCIFCGQTENDAKLTMKIQRWLQCDKCGDWMHTVCLDHKLNRRGTVSAALWDKLLGLQEFYFTCPEKCGDPLTIPAQLQTQELFSRDELLLLGSHKSHLLKKPDSDIITTDITTETTETPEDDNGHSTDDYDSDPEKTEEDKWRAAGAKPKREITPGFQPAPPVVPNFPTDSTTAVTGNVDVMQLMTLMFSKMQESQNAQTLMFSKMQESQNVQLQYQKDKDAEERQYLRDRILQDREERTKIRQEENEKWNAVQKLIEKTNNTTTSVEQLHSGVKPRVKLPTIEVPKFNGDILKWKEFWDLFDNLIHRNGDLSNVEKFSFLKSSLIGTAAAEIEACTITDANYDATIERLRRRYDNNMVIREQLMLQLQNLPVSGTKASDLRKTYNSIMTICTQLANLGRDICGSEWALVIVLQKIPPQVRLKLEEKKGDDTEWTFSLFQQYLEQYIRALEQTWMTKEIQNQTAGTSTTRPKQISPPTYKREDREPFYGRGSGAGLFAGKFSAKNYDRRTTPKTPLDSYVGRYSQKFPCVFCNGWNHHSESCPKVTSLKDRRQILIDARRCFICLKPNHSKNDCRHKKSTLACDGCGKVGLHHQSICQAWMEKRRRNNQNDDSGPSGGQVAAGMTTRHDETPIIPNATMVSAATSLDNQRGDSLKASSPKVLLQTATVEVSNPVTKWKIDANVLFDSGSSQTWITTKLVNCLKLRNLGPKILKVSTFGSNLVSKINGYEVELGFMLAGRQRMVCRAMVKDNLAVPVSRHTITDNDKVFLRDHPELRTAKGAFPGSFDVYEADIILGQDYFWDFVNDKKKTVRLASGLRLIPSRVGYLIGGKYDDKNGRQQISSAELASEVSCSYLTTTHTEKEPLRKIEDLWDLDIIGISDCPITNDDDKALQRFNDTIKFEDGRYQVTWMWKSDNVDLPENKGIAWGRFQSLTNRLRHDKDLLRKYDAIIQDQLNKGIVEKVTELSEIGPRMHYLPHHPVITPQKATTKVRIVYDASAKEKKGANSLNDCMHRGVVILPDLCGLLLRFRLAPIADVEKAFLQVGLQTPERDVTRFFWYKNPDKPDINNIDIFRFCPLADVEKAFLQVGLQTPERDVTRFFWYKNPDKPDINNIDIFRFCRVAFGIICSPFLLGATIKYHLNKIGTTVAQMIRDNIYVDNVLIGADNPEECQQIYLEAKEVFQSASMNLREWASNSPEFQNFLPDYDKVLAQKSKVLGLKWNIDDDSIQVPGSDSLSSDDVVTKRSILHEVAKIFDPLGLFNPVLYHGKLFLRRLWEAKKKWDEQLDTTLVDDWRKVEDILRQISTVSIPRHSRRAGASAYELLIFCDASKDVYATAVYLRYQIDETTFKTTLLFSKLRLAKMTKNAKTGQKEQISLPRLELLAVLIGVRAGNFVTKELKLLVNRRVLFTDSQVVLCWLQSTKPLPVFIENRLKEIRQTTDITFRYIRSEQNPADLLTRGLTVPELTDFWWHGPKWLENLEWPSDNMPDLTPEKLDNILSEETETKVFLFAGEGPPDEIFLIIDKFSSFRRLIGTIGYCLRLLKKIKKQDVQKGPLTADERENAETFLVKKVQQKYFPQVIEDVKNGRKNNLQQQLGLSLDNQGCLRCCGRLEKANFLYDTKYPRLLPKSGKFTELLIMDAHQRIFHYGISHTLAQIRLKYWITHGREAVRKTLKTCLICKQHQGGPFKLPPIPVLPEERVTKAKPFQYVGIDYFGPVWIKTPSLSGSITRKAWVCLFTCLTIRAVHLEVVQDLSAAQFLDCLIRFMGRRGKPDKIISDNAPHFKLTDKVLDRIWAQVYSHPKVIDYLSDQKIQWTFITEYAPWQGGFYERLVGLVKRGLRKGLGKRYYTYDELTTLLTQIEATVNSRPLTFINSDPSEQCMITPAHFLGSNYNIGAPDLPENPNDEYVPKLDSEEKLLRYYANRQQQLEVFWKTWSEDYLLSLREKFGGHRIPRIHETRQPRIGEVVLIKDDNLPRGCWERGRILFVNKRSARVLCPNGTKKNRPINLLVPLEIDPEVIVDDPAKSVDTGPAGEEQSHVSQTTDNTDGGRPSRKAKEAAKRRIQGWIQEEQNDNDDLFSASLGVLWRAGSHK